MFMEMKEQITLCNGAAFNSFQAKTEVIHC